MAPITDCLKQAEFGWTKADAKVIQKIKERMTKAPVMSLSDFSKVFEISCDVSDIEIGVLSQKNIMLPILVKN